jgi:hypothetical protein
MVDDNLAGMAVSDESCALPAFAELQYVVLALGRMQAKALEDSVYLTMTSQQAEECDERRKLITRLMKEVLLLRKVK